MIEKTKTQGRGTSPAFILVSPQAMVV